MNKSHIVVFSGAGISAESGLSTFRDNGGLWEKYRIEEVATPEAWQTDPHKVLEFYNMRYRQMKSVEPNEAHLKIAELEKEFRVSVVTQNVDDLHERAGSKEVIHLHGELAKCRSSKDESHILEMPESGLKIGMNCPGGHQLRPHIVWFGEMVPMMDRALNVVNSADVLIVVGTSLNVYPAAGIAYAAPERAIRYLIDPGEFAPHIAPGFRHIQKKATIGMEEVSKELLNLK